MTIRTHRRYLVSPERYRQITLVSVLLLVFIIVTGAAVRLTGSGLGCSDWPTCENDQLTAEIDDLHAMVEFVNRIITGLVSITVITAVLGSILRAPRRCDLVAWSLGLVIGVIAQIILGALVVREHLPPPLVMGHFLLSVVLVWNAMVLNHRAKLPDKPGLPRELPSLRRPIRALSLLAAVVLITGTFVTGSGPHSGSETQETKEALEAQGIDTSQLDPSELDVDRLPFDVVDTARIHGILVMILLAMTVWLALKLRHPHQPTDLFKSTQTLLITLIAQAFIGYMQYFTGVPALLVGLHVAGSVAVWTATLSLHLKVRRPLNGGTKVSTLSSSRQPEYLKKTMLSRKSYAEH